jgi:hypothetical protein
MINDQHFSGLAIDRMNALRVAAGGRANSYHDEIMMELAYGAQLGRAMRISPNVQYIVHPDSTGAPLRCGGAQCRGGGLQVLCRCDEDAGAVTPCGHGVRGVRHGRAWGKAWGGRVQGTIRPRMVL